jgi:hypothetical protein
MSSRFNQGFPLNNQGDLTWDHRSAIRWQIGPDRWMRLELESARKVLPIWSSQDPASRIETLLDETERSLSGQGDRHTVEALAEEFYSVLLDLVFETGRKNGSFQPVAAGWAAVQAARSSYDSEIGGAESEVEPEGWSASFHASVAWAGSATWEGVKGSDVRRAEFWTWWLKEADELFEGQATP